MDLKNKIFIGIGYTALIFAIGRYTVQKPTTDILETQQVQQTEDKHINTKKTVTETKKPDGTDTIVTVINQTVEDEKKDKIDTTVQIKEKPVNKPLSLAILAGADYGQPLKPVYGLSVSKEILGPITIGVFGLQNKTIGISIGLNF